MRRSILSAVASVALLIFFPPRKRHDLREKKLDIKYVFRFSVKVLSEKFLILRTAEPNIVTNRSSYEVKDKDTP
jgi:hypothetical protein